VLENQTPSEQTASRRFLDRKYCESDFPSRVSQLMAGVDYRRADSLAQRDAIWRLRNQATRREGAVSATSAMTLADPFDEAGNGYIFGLYVAGQLASSLRIHVGSKSQSTFPSLEVFPEYLRPELDVGKVVIDTTRFVADERLSREHRDLPYATLRLSMIAAEHFGAELLVAAVSAEQQPFYRRAFNYRMVCATRPYPRAAKPLCLMTLHFPSVAGYLYERYPFFRSSPIERQKLFLRKHFK
jgi:hypothetical protein